MMAAAAAFEHMPEPADHRVIDISGDGMANFGLPPVQARDALVRQGITINGLAILSEEPWLDDYYRQNVIGGPPSFAPAPHPLHNFPPPILPHLLPELAP